MTDKLTKSMECISYARVLIDVDVSKPLVLQISIIDAWGVLFDQEVCFEQESSFCSSCYSFGHVPERCHKSTAAPITATVSNTVAPSSAPVSGPSTIDPAIYTAQQQGFLSSASLVSAQVPVQAQAFTPP